MKTRLDPDAIDLEALRSTVESPGFRMIARRLAETYAAELHKLAGVANWDNTRYIQGMLAGLNVAAEVHKILDAEIRKKMAAKRKAGE